MTFEFFNSGRTAWGKKISGVFNTLELMANAAENRITEIASDAEYFLQYTSRNYRTPEPTRGDLPVRVEDALCVFGNIILLSDINYSNGTTTIKLIGQSPESGRPIVATIATTKTKGYVYITPPNGSETIKGNIQILDNIGTTDPLLMFEVTDNRLYIKNYQKLGIRLAGYENYTGFSITQVGTSSYTCNKKAECILATCGYTGNRISLNGVPIYDFVSLQDQRLWVPLYLRKGDKVTIDGRGTSRNIYRVTYNT